MRTPDSLNALVDHGIIEEVLRPLMSGKEAQIFLVLSGGEQRVAKIYKEAQNRTFQNRADYTEGRKVRNSRDQRAMSSRSRHGRAQNEAAWKSAEVDMIYRLRDAGVRVPTPYHFIDGVLIMELVTDAEGFPAPRLGDLTLEPDEATEVFDKVLREVVRMLCAGVVHGDLSDFNVLMSADGPVVIDFPQSVDASSNANARKLLLRDVDNLHRFHSKFVPGKEALPYAQEMWDLYQRNALTPETRLSGKFRTKQRAVSTEAVLDLIADADHDERRRRETRGLSMRGTTPGERPAQGRGPETGFAGAPRAPQARPERPADFRSRAEPRSDGRPSPTQQAQRHDATRRAEPQARDARSLRWSGARTEPTTSGQAPREPTPHGQAPRGERAPRDARDDRQAARAPQHADAPREERHVRDERQPRAPREMRDERPAPRAQLNAPDAREARNTRDERPAVRQHTEAPREARHTRDERQAPRAPQQQQAPRAERNTRDERQAPRAPQHAEAPRAERNTRDERQAPRAPQHAEAPRAERNTRDERQAPRAPQHAEAPREARFARDERQVERAPQQQQAPRAERNTRDERPRVDRSGLRDDRQSPRAEPGATQGGGWGQREDRQVVPRQREQARAQPGPRAPSYSVRPAPQPDGPLLSDEPNRGGYSDPRNRRR